MAEVETPPPTTEEAALVKVKMTGSLLDRWIEAGPDQALQRVEALVQTLERLRVASIRATYPSDWLIHTSTDRDGTVTRQVGYLQDCGAERAGKVWGIEVTQPIVERENHPDGTYSYHMLADGWSKVTGERVENAEGSRWSGSKFFERSVGPDEKIDPTNVRKSAWANLHGRAVRAIAGLSAVPLDVLRTAGIDVSKVMMIAYDKGARGGESVGASVGTTDVTVAFGRSQGRKPAELGDTDLDWYIKTYGENVADPGKARFVKANQRVLDALKVEKERRTQNAAHDEATGGGAPGAGAGDQGKGGSGDSPPPPSSRGRKLGDLQTLMSDAAGKDHRLIGAMLRRLTADFGPGKERSALSDLSNDEIDALLLIPAARLSTLAAEVKAAPKGGAK